MSTSRFLNSFQLILVFSIIMLISGCGGGGGSGSGDNEADEENINDDINNAPSIRDVSGTWTFNEKVVYSNCGPTDGKPFVYDVTITQSGDQITIVSYDDGMVSSHGTIDGNTISVTGTYQNTYQNNSGTWFVKNTGSYTLTVSEDGQTLNGTGIWTHTLNSETCSGRDELTGYKQ